MILCSFIQNLVDQQAILCAGFKPGQSADAHGLGYEEEVSVTLSTSQNQAIVAYGIDQQGGKGMVGYGINVSPTLAAESHGTPHAVCYGISAYDSNAMKSDNPHSGIYVAETTRTLDLNGGNPACNQGGMMVVAFTQNEREEVRDLGDKSSSLSAEPGTHQQTYVLENHPNDSRIKICEDDTFQTLSGRMGTNGNNTPMVMNVSSNWDGSQISPTLTANNANGAQRMPDKENFNAVLDYNQATNGFDSYNLQDTGNVGRCLSAAGGGLNEHTPCVYGVDTYNQTQSEEQAKTLNSAATDSDHIPCTYKGDTNMSNNAVVRRLTPRECERLQGMPDGWCDIGEWVDENGKKHKDADAPKYKALGNGIALPYWQWLAYRVTDQLKADGVENPTLFSMFDGIGSFCLAFKRAGCEPVAVSEIEPYPIAVCKKHFGDEDLGIEGDVEKYL